MILTSKYKLKNHIVLIVLNNDKLLVSKSNKLFIYDLLTNNYSFIVSLPCSLFIKLFSRVKLLSRLLRLGVRIAVSLSEDKLLIVFNKCFFEVSISDKSFEMVFNLPRGNRPLNIAKVDSINGFENTLYFGEYFNNFSRDIVNVYKRLLDGSWEIVYTFPEETIEHIHAIIPDVYRECLWVLTGDFDKASGIWMVKDNFKEVKPILINNQKFRACVAFPEPEGVIYATDSQFETNSIRLLRKKNDEWVSDLICEINGPAIYGCKVKSDLFFSTSVEGDSISKNFISKYMDRKPGPGIIEKSSHIVGGNLKNGFKILHKNKKDFFPFILFQFGAITFPTGKNETNHLFGFNIGLKKNDLDTEIYHIN
jgi:hypothetical protein